MTLNLSGSSIVALFGAMVVLAAVPSLNVLVVVTRSATFGFLHGVATAIGIVLGDIFFIAIAIGGLTVLAEKMGSLWVIIQCIGGMYLVFVGIELCRSQPTNIGVMRGSRSSLRSSFLTGLSITLGDQKATLFYLGFFPAFIDLHRVSYLDLLAIAMVTIVAVGGVKVGYAALANRARFWWQNAISGKINLAAGLVTIAVGLFLIVKPWLL